ncbi:ATP-binding protein [Qiania dongpingensis]|uniref:ATP-binding protein n=1 Tax=Qiania dongpingensis TaxID=2763669 RepID=A0A7G9G3E8_9FIRM|nr:ATP-binding protein [Qiania dongpingensis]QNM05330.1 ATP-binding protein [Qiania dongpingensis]
MEYQEIIRKTYRTFFIPTAISTMGTAVMSLLNILFAGLFFGGKGSYVVGLALPVMIFTNIITYFFGVGGGIAVSIRQGQGDKKEASRIFTAAVFGTAVLGILALIFGVLMSGSLLPLLGARTFSEQDAAGEYVRILFMGMPFLLLCGVLNAFIRNDSHPGVAMAGTLISIFSNLILLWLFIGGMKLPVSCIAAASVISNGLCVLFYLGYFLSGRSVLRFRIGFRAGNLKEIAQPGFAGSMIFLAQTILTVIINNVLLDVSGTSGIAAYGVVKYAVTFIYAVYDSVNHAAQPMFSVYYGEQDVKSIRLTAKTAGRVLACGAVLLCLLLCAGAPYLSLLFSLNVTAAVRMIGLSCLFSSAAAFLNSLYRSTGKPGLSLIFTVLDNLLFPALFIWVLVYGAGLSENGVWASLLLSEVLTLLTAVLVTKGSLLQIRASEIPEDRIYQTLILNEEANIVALNEEIEAFCNKNGIDGKKQYYILLCIEEIAVNIIKYGFKDGKKHYIDIRIAVGEQVLLNIRDDAVQFDPTAKKDADITAGAESRDIGGLGIYLVKKVAKEFSYKRVIGFNNLHIVL